jgi:PAS domain-containing protein
MPGRRRTSLSVFCAERNLRALIVIAHAALIGGLLIHRYRRRRAEDGLRQSESRTSAVLRALPDLMFVLDSQGRIWIRFRNPS